MLTELKVAEQGGREPAPPDRRTEVTGLIFDIQGHSVHDGPGTRTTVFLSGCPLRCTWCCNPEGLCVHPRLMYIESKCEHCGNCIAECPENAITVDKLGRLHHNREICEKCRTFNCVEGCYHEALRVSGRYYTVEELMRIFKRDRMFWSADGGVTLSGGEPLLQRRFVEEVLKQCEEAYIHTAIETTGHLDTDYFLRVLKHVEWMFMDIKHMDPEAHKQGTGVDNKLILHNLRAVAASDWSGRLIIRIPIIPGFNDSADNVTETARFVKGLGLDELNILPFHRLGESKYEQLDLQYAFAHQEVPSDEHMQKLQNLIEKQGVRCYVGYRTPF